MNYILRNALIATGDKQGTVLADSDILVKDGKIEAIGQGLQVNPDEKVEAIDLRGKMVIPGLINAHSHSYANLA
ncbi:MAG: hypothetical protein GX039_02705 [Clostridia bacterium]|nr:hypothetical protein [Clostridia bacterium]